MIDERDIELLDGGQGGVAAVIPIEEAPLDILDDIEKWLSRFAQWGLNPDDVSLTDFDIQFYVPGVDDRVTFSVSHLKQPLLAFRHKETGKGVAGIATVFQGGWGSHYPTAGLLISLAEEDEEE